MNNKGLFGVFSPAGRSIEAAELQAMSAGSEAGTAIAANGLAAQGQAYRDDSGLLIIADSEQPISEFGPAAVAAYRAHGDNWINKLGGAFALALFDPAQSRLQLAVDRMGIRPLAYSMTAAGDLVFSSRLDEIARHPAIDVRLSHQAIHDFFFFHMVPSPACIYVDVHKLRPAHCLDLSAGQARVHRYWMPQFNTGTPMDSAALERGLHDALRQGIGDLGPGPGAGGFLSGGIDSSSVLGYMSELSPQPVPAFSVGFSSAEEFDELAYARIATQRFGLESHLYDVTVDDIVEAVPRIAAAYDEPFGNSSAVPTLKCAEFARQSGIQRLFAGDGGDELFAGNPHYSRQKLFAPYAGLPASLRGFAEGSLFQGLCRGPLSKLGSYVRQASIPMPDRNWSWNYMYRQARDEVFAGEFLAEINLDNPLQLMQTVYAETPDETPLVDRMLYLDWQFILADSDLRKVGRMCELAGVEVCFPMLADGVVDLSLQVPASKKLPGQRLRHFYKHAMRDFLPTEILRKKKQGFGLPFGQWLKENKGLQDLVYPALESFAQREILHPEFLPRLVAEHRDGHASYHGYVIWDVLMLETWLQAHGHAA